MKNLYLKIRDGISDLWATNRPLTFVGVMMVCDVAACLVAMIFDSRQITGINAWIKPAKFGLSSAITCLTLAWIAVYLAAWPRVRDWSCRVFAASIAFEIVIIDLQAARGTTSHFNVSTPFDKAAFVVMGISIATLWISMAGMTYALFRQKVAPDSWCWALRLGLLASLIGAAAGGFMLHQTPEQKSAGDGHYFGAHTVGASDGGPGLPFLNWSTAHGDLRVAHFLGLHAVQFIPLMAWWLSRRKRLLESQRTQLVWMGSILYFLCFVITAWQAQRGQTLVQPDGLTLGAELTLVGIAGMGTTIILSPALRVAMNDWARVLEVRL